MQTLAEIKALLAAHGLRPRHRFGQNFLVEPRHLERLLDEASIAPGDLVLEVGPGTGTLTEELLARGAEVLACEIDRDLAALLRERFGGRIDLVEGDCLGGKHRLSAELVARLGDRPFTLVANLPYSAASPLLANLAALARCRGCFVTVQREVAERLAAPPGTRAYGPLSIVLQLRFEIRRIGDLPPGCFWPPPEVTSSMVALRSRGAPLLAPEALPALGRFVQRVFGRRRKQLGAILGRAAPLPAGISQQQRPESLGITEWVALFAALGQADDRGEATAPIE